MPGSARSCHVCHVTEQLRVSQWQIRHVPLRNTCFWGVPVARGSFVSGTYSVVVVTQTAVFFCPVSKLVNFMACVLAGVVSLHWLGAAAHSKQRDFLRSGGFGGVE